MDLTDTQTALIRLWAHTDWHYIATLFAADGRQLHTPSAVCGPIQEWDPARTLLGADCWHADYLGIWAGGTTPTSSPHLVRWTTVWTWLNTWPTDDRTTAVNAARAFDSAIAARLGEQPRPGQTPAQRQAARDRRQARLERGGYDAITTTRRTVQALIDHHTGQQPTLGQRPLMVVHPGVAAPSGDRPGAA